MNNLPTLILNQKHRNHLLNFLFIRLIKNQKRKNYKGTEIEIKKILLKINCIISRLGCLFYLNSSCKVLKFEHFANSYPKRDAPYSPIKFFLYQINKKSEKEKKIE